MKYRGHSCVSEVSAGVDDQQLMPSQVAGQRSSRAGQTDWAPCQ